MRGLTNIVLQKSYFLPEKESNSIIAHVHFNIKITSLFSIQITDKVHVLWEQPSSSGKSVLSNNRHPSERRSHLYGNRTNSSLLMEWKKTLYNVSWLVTISFVV